MSRVSIIIPAYNAMTYLPKTLESALRQTFIDFDVFIINDGSSDGIVEWASQIQDPRVHLISQDNQGSSRARNNGIWCSKAEYLAFLDSDDIWEPTKLEQQVACLDNDPSIGIVSSWIKCIDESDNLIESPQTPTSQGDELKRDLFVSNVILCGSTPMVRRCCFEKVGFFDRTLRSAEDWDMWLRLAPHYQFFVIQEPLVQYRKHSNSLSKNLKVMVESVTKVLERAFQSAPIEYRHLKGIGASMVCVNYGWAALTQKENLQEAYLFAKLAFINNPKVIFSYHYLHLIALILVKSLLGSHRYKTLITLRNKIGSKHFTV